MPLLALCLCVALSSLLFADALQALLVDWARMLIQCQVVLGLADASWLDAIKNAQTMGDILEIVDQASWITASVLGLVLCGTTVFLWQASPRERYAKTLSMEDVLRTNAKHNPALLPILSWGRSLLLEDVDHGPWMCARQPIQFAAMHGLLRKQGSNEPVPESWLVGSDGLANLQSPILQGKARCSFDTNRCRAIFQAQMGPLWQWEELPGYMRVLAVAFCCFGLDAKDEAHHLLASLNRGFQGPTQAQGWHCSWHPPFVVKAKPAKPRCTIHLPQLSKELLALRTHPEIVSCLKAHNRYAYLAMLALFAFAKRKGVLCTQEFIWLRPVNRTLFYLFNTMGRRTVWVECAGPWAHYQAECILARDPDFEGINVPQNQVFVLEAIRGLARALASEGWITWEEGKMGGRGL
ncbi:MAG: hypothetical protein IJS54_02615 [Desulfovibrio sp.]|nr:hypothetical protein [Desulfovibrio sp.]